MGYYDGNTVTAFWNYAQNFAMSDNSFSTVFGPSTPGALNLISGQTHGATITLEARRPATSSAGSVIGDPRPSLALDDCTITSKTLHLHDRQERRRSAQREEPHLGLVPGRLQAELAKCGWHRRLRHRAQQHLRRFGRNRLHPAPRALPVLSRRPPIRITCRRPPSPTIGTDGSGESSIRHQRLLRGSAARAICPRSATSKLPLIRMATPRYSDPLDEQTFVVNTINALMQSPFWNSTAIIIAYDDSDGWYDHVIAPIVNQSNTPDDNLTGAGDCGDGDRASTRAAAATVRACRCW